MLGHKVVRCLLGKYQSYMPMASTVKHGHNDSVHVADQVAEEVESCHVPVMAKEIVEILNPEDGKIYVDMTFGGGGHTKLILDKSPRSRIFGLDRDPTAHNIAKNLAKRVPQITPLLGRFSEVKSLLESHDVEPGQVDGFLFDVGVSSMQFDTASRGFSISQNAPLDMRMDQDRYPDQVTAEDVVNHMDEQNLYQVIKKYGEEKRARLIAKAIVDTRYAFGPIRTTKQLANLVSNVFEETYVRDKLNRRSHVATKTFQALRIFVNNELNELNNGLHLAHHLLRPGGICVCLSFHSLEDRIIKRQFHGIDMDAKFNMGISQTYRNSMRIHDEKELSHFTKRKWDVLSRKVLLPSAEEVATNPRARSAKLRAARKVDEDDL